MRAFSIFSTPLGLSVAQRHARRHLLARMGLAWLAMMQVMMFAFPGYLRSERMGPDNLALLDDAIVLMNGLSLALTVPVVLYCAWPVWAGAWRGLRRGGMSMDVPVALGILVAFVPSVRSTLAGHGAVYFESVCMFIAFLLTARYLELCARQSVGEGGLHARVAALRRALSTQADRAAFWFVLAQLALAVAAGAAWLSWQPDKALGVVVALIVISCPCAMAMAVPTAVAAAHASLAVASGAHAGTSGPAMAARLRATARVARQSLFGAILWHLLVTPLAAVGWVAPWLAALTMLASSLAVAAHAWLLYRRLRHSDEGAPYTAVATHQEQLA